MRWRYTTMFRAVVALGGLLVLVNPTAAAGGSASEDETQSPTKKSAESASKPVEPLEMRAPPSPVFAIRPISRMKEQIARGTHVAFEQLEAAIAKTTVELSSFPPETWKDDRNRLALVEFTIEGGSPSLLRELGELRAFPEGEQALAHGTLAYAEGYRAAADELLQKVEPRKLPPALSGKVALLRATLAVDTDLEKAQELCDLAWLLSPGTHVEEASRRLRVELAILGGDRGRVQQAVARYFWRFPKSPYLQSVAVSIAPYVVSQGLNSGADGAAWFEEIVRMLPSAARTSLLQRISVAGLRLGKPLAVTAAVKMLKDAASGEDVLKWSIAHDGAARIVAADTEAGLGLLIEAERMDLSVETTELIGAARILAGVINAPVADVEGAAVTDAKSQSVVQAGTGNTGKSEVRNGDVSGVPGTTSAEPDDVATLVASVANKLEGVDRLLLEASR